MSLKISISWLSGSGKTSIIKEIVSKMWFETADVGQIYRNQSASMGMTINEFTDYLNNNPQEDISMEKRFKEFVENCPKDIIVSWRVGFHFVPNIISIWLDVDPRQWAKRVMLENRVWHEQKFKSIDEIIEANEIRMIHLKDRLIRLYWVDFTDKSNYTKIIDTTSKDFEEVVNEIMDYIKELKNS